MDTRSKYEKFLNAYLEANPSLKKSEAYINAQKLWNKVKHDDEKLNSEILRLKAKSSSHKSQNMKAFFHASSKVKKSRPAEESKQSASSDEVEIVEKDSNGTTSANKSNETKGLYFLYFCISCLF